MLTRKAASKQEVNLNATYPSNKMPLRSFLERRAATAASKKAKNAPALSSKRVAPSNENWSEPEVKPHDSSQKRIHPTAFQDVQKSYQSAQNAKRPKVAEPIKTAAEKEASKENESVLTRKSQKDAQNKTKTVVTKATTISKPTMVTRQKPVTRGDKPVTRRKVEKSVRIVERAADVKKTKQKPDVFIIPIPKALPQESQGKEFDMSNFQSAIDHILDLPPEGVTDIDTKEQSYFYEPVYANDIVSYLKNLEFVYKLPPNYLVQNPHVHSNMRAILVDWLIQVQNHLMLEQETLHLSVAMLDQYLLVEQIEMAQLQLLGITCVLISSKFTERFNPQIDTLTRLTDDTYVFNEVINMEKVVLAVLKFQVHLPIPTDFLQRFQHPFTTDSKVDNLCRYFIDLSLTDLNCASYSPSMKAAGGVCLSSYIFPDSFFTKKNPEVFEKTLNYYTGYTVAELRPCMKRYARLLIKCDKAKYKVTKGARDKYSSNSMHGAISTDARLTTSPFVVELASEAVPVNC